jgi:hypothetical protein
MSIQNRRKFLALSAMLTAGLTAFAMPFKKEQKKKSVTHHVYFWLRNPGSKEDLEKLLAGLRTLKEIDTVREIHVGVPASTEARAVVDNTYSASELLFFDDLEGQKHYQDHPIHLKFVENCSHLWEKVIVYDSIDV